MACYHAQQCAEKYLKGFLVSRSHSFNFVHDLFYLTQECAQRQPAFRELELAAETLGRYGAGVRYPLENFVDPGRRRGLGSNKTSRGSRNLCKEPTLVPCPPSRVDSLFDRPGPVGAGLVPALAPPSRVDSLFDRPGPVGAGLVPALAPPSRVDSLFHHPGPVGAGLVPALAPPSRVDSPFDRPGPVGAGLVPALCLSKSRYTISPTAAAHSSPDPSNPKNELHPDGFGS